MFDLDDTLHNASAHIFPIMNRAMTRYIQDTLQMQEHEACALRQHYWRIYGATLKGLVRHHGVDPYHFLHETHQFLQPDMVLVTKQLRHFLRTLKGRKVIFTNAPRSYALRVLDLLGIADMFELVFSVENTKFHAKPSVRGFSMLLRSIQAEPGDCVILDDNATTLMTAKRLGMRTVWVTRARQKPNFVDHRVNSILALTHLHI